MDISSRFSLADFLAYLFPGIFGTMGLYYLLMLTPLRQSLVNFSTDLTTGILFLAFSYIFGVILSGFTEIFASGFRHKSIPLSGFEEEIKKAFKAVFDAKEISEWTRVHYYLCRSIVFEYMPNAFQTIQRQSGLRQLRMNMLPSTIIWFVAGIAWGWDIINNGVRQWGITLIIISSVFWTSFFIVTINRMKSNDQRETRETLSAFLAGYKAGLFDKVKRSVSKIQAK